MINIIKIHDWLIEMQNKEDIEEYVTAFEKVFGYLEMSNGLQAQIQIKLEMDTEDWN